MIPHNIYRCSSFSWKINAIRLYSSSVLPDIDLNYYCNIENINEIKNNIQRRKGVGDIDKALYLYKTLKTTSDRDHYYDSIKLNLFKELNILPNRTHPTVENYADEPHVIHEINQKKDFGKNKPLEFSRITELLNLMRTDKLGYTCGNKSYYYFGALAELEEALIKYTVSTLLGKDFLLISVPDILPRNLLEGCGMAINTDRTQVNIVSDKICGL